MNNKKIRFFGIACTVVALLGATSRANAAIGVAYRPEVSLQQEMRKLWEDHILWTRLVILSIVDNVPGSDAAVKRLLQNPTDIANILKQFYGDTAANNFASLMKDHLTIAADLVKAAASGDSAKADEAEKQWYANANAIATFMAKTNPKYWPAASVRDMLYEHLKYTKAEALARINKDYTGDVAAYDTIHNQALMMADGMSDGIAAQFPGKVRKFNHIVAERQEPVVEVRTSDTLGDYLAASNGMTLYTFASDTPNQSTCVTGTCAMTWLPLTVKGALKSGQGVSGVLQTINRGKGVRQVTYNGAPLYFWMNDKIPGDITGNGVDNLWSVAKP